MHRQGLQPKSGKQSNWGDDLIVLGAGEHAAYGRRGDDVIIGGDGNDGLYGNSGDDLLVGGAGNNVLRGGRGDDVLTSGAGDSTLQSSGGYKFADHLYGGAGVDSFVFTNPHLLDAMNELAWIADYHKGETIDLSGIDADTKAAGDQAFVLVDRMPQHAGEAYAVYDGWHQQTVVYLEVDDASSRDFVIGVSGQHLDVNDLVL